MKATQEHQLPAAIDAEKSVLGSILLNNETYPEAASLLTPEEFHLDSHRKLFSSMVEIFESGGSVDLITITNQLATRKEIEAVGGVTYISSLTDGLPLRPSIASYCKIVRDKYRRRQLILACETGIAAALENTESTPECLSIVEEKLLAIRGNEVNSKLHPIREVMPEVVEQLRDEAEGRAELGISYGLTSLDDWIGRMRPEELIVIGALPGRGKTALSAQIISANAPGGLPVLDFSLEMSRWQLGKRLIAANSRVPAARIRQPKTLKETWTEVLETAGKLSDWPVWFDDSATITLQELTARARLAVRQHGIKVVIVDYLRLVSARGKDLREKVGNVANGLRILAKQERITVVLLSQLSRPKEINERPTMLDLKESGDIEAHANVVLLLYTPEEKGQPTGEDEIVIGKCREGTRGPVPVFLDKRKLQFVPRETEGDLQ